jgi:hypothetical protein
VGTGTLCRNKKFSLEVGKETSKLFMCGRGQFIPEQIKEYNFGYKRRKQLAKALLVDVVSNEWMSKKDFVDFLLGEELVHKMELLALVTTFNRTAYLEERDKLIKGKD